MKRARLLFVAGLATIGLILAALGTLCLTSGCSTLAYYGQAVGGHLDLMQRSRAVPQWLADPATAPALRERLQLSQRMRDFAVAELKLPDNRSYRAYADLGRGAVVWNVVAAPELSLTLKTWCFAVMGCVGYRGYFDRAAADALAAELKREGWEVSVYGVPAYSTLGWTDWLGGDPLLNTFLNWPEGELARIIFHELAHQVVYVNDDTTFNESFATAVERIGGQRWLATRAGDAARAEYARLDERRRDFRELTLRQRDRLKALYASPRSDDDKRRGKSEAKVQIEAEIAALKTGRWAGFSGYDAWFANANNASYGVQAAYQELVPGFERLFEREGRDLERFYAAVRQLAALPKDERRAKLLSTPRGERLGRPAHPPRPPTRPGQGPKDRVAMGRGGRIQVLDGVHRDRGRDQRHDRIHALRSQRPAGCRIRPLRTRSQARLPARRLQPPHRIRDRPDARRFAGQERQARGQERRGEEGLGAKVAVA